MKTKEFEDWVSKEFSFLVTQFGYIQRKIQNDHGYLAVNFDRSMIAFEVYLQPNENEVGVLVRPSNDEEYSVHTYLQLVDPSLAASFGYAISINDSEVLELISKFAEALRSRCISLVQGDKESIERLRDAENNGMGLTPYVANRDRFCGNWGPKDQL